MQRQRHVLGQREVAYEAFPVAVLRDEGSGARAFHLAAGGDEQPDQDARQLALPVPLHPRHADHLPAAHVQLHVLERDPT